MLVQGALGQTYAGFCACELLVRQVWRDIASMACQGSTTVFCCCQILKHNVRATYCESTGRRNQQKAIRRGAVKCLRLAAVLFHVEQDLLVRKATTGGWGRYSQLRSTLRTEIF